MLMLVLGCAAPAVADEPAKRVSVERVLMGVGLVGLGATATLDVRRRTAGRLLHHEDRAQLAASAATMAVGGAILLLWRDTPVVRNMRLDTRPAGVAVGFNVSF
jgi:hypothetical protein